MRKELKKVVLMMMIGTIVFTTGCGTKEQEIETFKEVTAEEKTTEEKTTQEATTEEISTKLNAEDDKTQEVADNSSYPTLQEIEEVRWVRDAEQDSESLCFAEDNYFVYGCDCGNPVGDSDLYEAYSYDQATGVFTMSGGDGDIYIKIIEYDGDSIVLEMPEELGKGEKTFTRSAEEN